MNVTDKKDLRIRSKVISEGLNSMPNRSMLRAVGFTDEDFKKADDRGCEYVDRSYAM